VVKYYAAMGRTIAMPDGPVGRTVPAGGGHGTLSYPLLDHLGSTVGMTDSNGVLTGTQSYWPYGTVRTTTGVFSGPLPGQGRAGPMPCGE
jgi:hypothetical protein